MGSDAGSAGSAAGSAGSAGSAAGSAGSAAASPPATIDDAARLIATAFGDPKSADAAALVPAGRKVAVKLKGGGSGKQSVEGLAELRELAAGNATTMKLQACKDKCCDFTPEHGDDRQLGAQLRRVCFDDQRIVTSVEVTYAN